MDVVLVCRGCCCGTTKHPETDHEAQLETLREVADILVTPCLGPCRRSNVVAVVDPDSGEQTWFGGVLAPEDTAAVARWLTGDPTGTRARDLTFEPPSTASFRALLRARVRRPERSGR